MPRRLGALLALGAWALLLAPACSAAPPPSLADLQDALGLGLAPSSGALSSLASGESGLDAAERQLFESQLLDPTRILNLPAIPAELVENVTLQRLGPILGPHIEDVPDETLLSAVALLPPGATLPASSLRTFHDMSVIRNEDAASQAADMAALLAGDSAAYDPGLGALISS